MAPLEGTCAPRSTLPKAPVLPGCISLTCSERLTPSPEPPSFPFRTDSLISS